MQDALKAVWSIPYFSVAFFPSLKQNFIAYHSSKVSSCPDCIFDIHQLWPSGFSRVYSNCCCSCSFEAEIIKICQSSHKMHSNWIPNFQESMTIPNAGTKKSGTLLNVPCKCVSVWIQLIIHRVKETWVNEKNGKDSSNTLIREERQYFFYWKVLCSMFHFCLGYTFKLVRKS